MRKILNCSSNEIIVSGDGITYHLNRSENIISPIIIEDPKIMTEITQRVRELSIIDKRSERTTKAFIENISEGTLSLNNNGYGWLNSWCYTSDEGSYKKGRDYIIPLEKTLFGFEIGEKISGKIDEKPIKPGVDYIFNLAAKKLHKEYGPCSTDNQCVFRL